MLANSQIPEEYKEEYQKNKARLIALKELDDDWVEYEDRDNVSLYCREIEDNPVKMLRLETIFKGTVPEVASLLFDEPEELLNSKEMIKSAEIVENNDNLGRVLLVTTKPKYFVSSREILVYCNSEAYENGLIHVQVGLEVHAKVPLKNDAVRTTTLLGGYFLLPVEDAPEETRVIFIIHNILNGKIPSFVQNMVVSQHIDGYVYLIGVSNKRAAIKAEKVAKEAKEREKQAKLLEEEEKAKKLAEEEQKGAAENKDTEQNAQNNEVSVEQNEKPKEETQGEIPASNDCQTEAVVKTDPEINQEAKIEPSQEETTADSTQTDKKTSQLPEVSVKEGESSTATEVSFTSSPASNTKEPSKLEDDKGQNVDGEGKSGDKESTDQIQGVNNIITVETKEKENQVPGELQSKQATEQIVPISEGSPENQEIQINQEDQKGASQ